MKRARIFAGTIAVTIALLAASVARADAHEHRVLLAGSADILERVGKEVAALGYPTEETGPLESCREGEIAPRMTEHDAPSLVCAEREQIYVWALDRGRPRLVDTIDVPRDGDRAAEESAIRAAESVRAAFAAPEAEAEPAVPPTAVEPPPPPLRVVVSTERDKGAVPRPAPAASPHGPQFLGGLAGGLLSSRGTRAALKTASARLEVGGPRARVMARLDYPTEEIELAAGRQVTPVLTAIGIDVPLADPSARVIPRFGAAIGMAWLRTTSDNITVKVPGQRPIAPPPEDDQLKSFAAYVMGGLAVRVVGPLRLTGDVIAGRTAQDLRAGVASEVTWGSLFGSVCLGAELTTN